MATGFGMPLSGGGDYKPAVKFDLPSGQFTRSERNEIGEMASIDIKGQPFVIDCLSLRVGPLRFTAQGPDRSFMVPFRQPIPTPPADAIDEKGRSLYRPGFCFQVGGQALKGLCEWMSNSVNLVTAMSEFWERQYTTAPEAALGKLPVCVVTGVKPVSNGSGLTKRTYYRPIIEIRGWVDRDPAIWGEATVAPPKPSSAAPMAQPAPAPAAAPAAAPQQSKQLVEDEMPF